MKITFFIGSVSGGGAERVVCNLANFLAGKEHEVKIIVVSESEKNYPLAENIKTVSLETEKRIKFTPLRIMVKMLRLKELVKKTETDIWVPFLPKTIFALFHYKKYIKAPIVATESNNPAVYKKRLIKKLLKCFNAADGAVFLNKEAESFYKERTLIKSSAVIPNAVNAEFIKPPFTGDRKKEIVSVGRHAEQKNHALLINAFYDVLKSFPDYTLKIYGQGPLTQSYIRQVKELGIEKSVEFAGFTKDVQDKIYDASAFVLSSDYEGMPVALIEAMALGVPCVSTDCKGGGARAIIEDGVNGFIVPRGDKNALSSAIKKIIADKALANAFSLKAREIVNRYSPQVIYPEWEKYFFSILKNEI